MATKVDPRKHLAASEKTADAVDGVGRYGPCGAAGVFPHSDMQTDVSFEPATVCPRGPEPRKSGHAGLGDHRRGESFFLPRALRRWDTCVLPCNVTHTNMVSIPNAERMTKTGYRHFMSRARTTLSAVSIINHWNFVRH